MKTKLVIIAETILAYADPKNRAVSDGACHYLNPDGSGRMCAFGRCMEHPNVEDGRWVGDMERDTVEDELKPEYRGHEKEFWMDLQKFHDNNHHFTPDSISQLGEGYINKMMQRWVSETVVA